MRKGVKDMKCQRHLEKEDDRISTVYTSKADHSPYTVREVDLGAYSMALGESRNN